MNNDEIRDIILESISGMKTGDALRRIDMIVKDCKDLIIFSSGINFPWDKVIENINPEDLCNKIEKQLKGNKMKRNTAKEKKKENKKHPYKKTRKREK